MAGLYRDPNDAIADRLRDLRRELQPLEAQLTEPLRESLPPGLQERLARGAAAATRADTEEPVRLVPLLEGYRDALREAVGLAPRIAAALARLPGRAPELRPRRRYGLADHRHDADEVVARIWRVVTRLDAEAAVERVGGEWLMPVYFRARFRARDAPFAFLIQPLLTVRTPLDLDAEKLRAAFELGTGVAQAAPRLRLFAQTQLSARWARRLRLIRDVELGHPEFDEAFVVDAAPADARRLLTRAAREALVRLATRHGARPVGPLEVESGTAILRWTSELTVPVLDAATRALGAIRAAPCIVDLLHKDG